MKKYLIYISFTFIIITCKSIDKDNEANLVINYFSTHKAQLEKFKNITISKRSENNYIYGLDSIHVGLYLIKSNNDDSLFYISEISKNEVVSLLKEKGIRDIAAFLKNTIKIANQNLSLLKRLNLESVNSCPYKDYCTIEFITKSGVTIIYKKENIDKFEEKINENYKRFVKEDKHWIYYY